ncbi:MAG: hypothetical protein ACPGO3_07860 [Magnetospiraceae bacterium]
MSRDVRIAIDTAEFPLTIEGETLVGGPEVMARVDDDLTAGQPWQKAGYVVTDFLTPAENQTIREGLADLVRESLEAATGLSPADFDPSQYHTYLRDDADHVAFCALIKDCFPYDRFPLDICNVEARISEICGVDVWVRPRYGPAGFCIRVIRPARTDFNPPHRDVWLDRLRHGINLYFPIAGSTENSSLPLVPGSHFWREDQIERTAAGARVNGVNFTVPAVVDWSPKTPLMRPNPNAEQVMVFSPYLIHGGGINAQRDVTRVSLEMRLWRRDAPVQA